ncbi:NAD-dependent epimerase/dehydratase family protein [Amnibacterium kyonggiense]|uniref:dTDP-L-rhamnose 4-epimerase n=1 Tax=Amnibacterium kyonggiense TaxID=595671 RepID=A0A4R7FS95_9MICO|nr:NAD-dependent epimerase/dehydratase family protein [Amnibacterium kyonggiense]TDS80690.1 dTDP-L-rhamnose 4-epimerase [Amnibacterium kyonggiense]
MGVLLVTGGAGFIGGAVARRAQARGLTVRVLDSLRPDVHAADATPPSDLETVVGDVTDPATVAAALEGVDVVCHQAAKVGLGVDFADAPDYVRTNDLGTAVLLAAMAAARIDRLVLASSMVVYGEGAYASSRGPVAVPPRRPEDLAAGRFEPIDPETGEDLEPRLVPEDAPIDPRNVYAATKAQQEALATVWARETGGRVAALRYHNVYGPGMPRDTPYAGVAALFRSQLERGEAPTVLEDGRQRRDFVHVDDIAAANVAALAWTAGQPAGAVRAFNAGSGVVHTIGDLAEALSAARGGPSPVVTGGYRLGDVRHITASSERLRAELDVPAPVPFDEGVRAFALAPLREAP